MSSFLTSALTFIRRVGQPVTSPPSSPGKQQANSQAIKQAHIDEASDSAGSSSLVMRRTARKKNILIATGSIVAAVIALTTLRIPSARGQDAASSNVEISLIHQQCVSKCATLKEKYLENGNLKKTVCSDYKRSSGDSITKTSLSQRCEIGATEGFFAGCRLACDATVEGGTGSSNACLRFINDRPYKLYRACMDGFSKGAISGALDYRASITDLHEAEDMLLKEARELAARHANGESQGDETDTEDSNVEIARSTIQDPAAASSKESSLPLTPSPASGSGGEVVKSDDAKGQSTLLEDIVVADDDDDQSSDTETGTRRQRDESL